MIAIADRLREKPFWAAIQTFAALALILTLAALVRIWGWEYGLPHPQARPDEEIVLGSVFQMFARGRMVPLTFAYPSLPMYIDILALNIYLKVGQLIGHYDKLFDMLFDIAVSRPGLHYRIARGVSIGFSIGTVAATYFLGSAASGRRRVGLLAALLTATCLLHVAYTKWATVDSILTLFVTLSLAFAVKAAQDPKLANFVGAGIFAGFAASSKYNGALVLTALAVPIFFALFSVDAGSRRRLIAKLALAGALATLVFGLTSPYAVLRYEEVQKAFAYLGKTLYSAPDEPAFVVHLRDTFPKGLGWPFYLASIVGVMRAIWLRRPADLALLGFAIPLFVTVAPTRLVFPRYVVPLVPILAVMAAQALYPILSRVRPPVAALGVVLFTLPGLWSTIRFDRLAALRDTRLLAVDWLGENVAPRTKIAVCNGYGAPSINTDRRRPPAFEPQLINCSARAMNNSGARYVVTHEYAPLNRGIRPKTREFLAENGTLLAKFDPLRTDVDATPFFYKRDAFYLPLAGFAALERGGPVVSIWEID